MRKTFIVILLFSIATACFGITKPKYYFVDELPEIDIRAYGVIPGASSDCGPAVASAMADLPDSGGTILFPPGAYRFDTSIVIPVASGTNLKPVTLKGFLGQTIGGGTRTSWAAGGTSFYYSGPDTFIKGRGEAGTDENSFYGSIENLNLYGTATTSATIKGANFYKFFGRIENVIFNEWGTGIDIDSYCYYSVFKNARFYNCEYAGLDLTVALVNGVVFRDCMFSSCGTGVIGTYCGAPVVFDGCWFEGNADYAFKFDRTLLLEFTGCYFENTVYTGLFTGTSSMYRIKFNDCCLTTPAGASSGLRTTGDVLTVFDNCTWNNSAGLTEFVTPITNLPTVFAFSSVVTGTIAPFGPRTIPQAFQMVASGSSVPNNIVMAHTGTGGIKGGENNVLMSTSATDASGTYNVAIACATGMAAGQYSVILSSFNCITNGQYQVIAGSQSSTASGVNNVILGSRGVLGSGNYRVEGGYLATTTPSVDNITWRLDSQNGTLWLKPRGDAPAIATGTFYADTDGHAYYCNGTSWAQIDN